MQAPKIKPFGVTLGVTNLLTGKVRVPITIKYVRKVATLTRYLASIVTNVRDLM